MICRKQRILFTSLVFITRLVAVNVSFAQVLVPDRPMSKYLLLAGEQFQQGQYAIAAQSANTFLNAASLAMFNVPGQDIDEAHYYQLVSNLKLDVRGAVAAAETWVKNNSDPVYKQRVAFAIAQYYFRHNLFANAIPWYEDADISNLSNFEIATAKFELAYCYFNNSQFNKAEPLFATIKELEQGKYYKAGNYYYGLLAYNSNNYESALKSFEIVKDLDEYKSIVPYYIAEIYYFTGDRKKAYDYAMELMGRKKDKLYYDNELHLLAAQCLFELQKFDKALPFFEYYYDRADKIRKEELYEMAYCYYRINDFAKAIEKFKPLSNANDSLGQTSMYLLGDSYLKEEDKQSARNAFGLCADMAFNPELQESSMMLYAKLSYEMGYNDQAAAQFKELNKTFPHSRYIDESKTLLSDLYLKTNNYTDALTDLAEVKHKDDNYYRIYQKVTYGNAMRLLKAGNIDEADKYLDLSLKNPVDDNYQALSNFWKGDVAYRRRNFTNTIKYSQLFLNSKANFNIIRRLSPVATPQHAWLNMGYAAMELNSYHDAQTYFSHSHEEKGEDASIGMIATVREADAVFMQKDYAKAITLYDRVIAAGDRDADYARYQKSTLEGLLGKTSAQIAILQSLISKLPESPYAGKARYALALVYIQDNKYQEAINLLQPLTSLSSYRDLASKAWIKTGFAYQQIGNNKAAIDAYKQVVANYPSSEERTAALDALRSLYIENNQPGAYTRLLKENNLPTADSNMVDSTYYAAAESQFSSGNWENAKSSMTLYLQQYPHGAFTVRAYYYRAQSFQQLKQAKEALADYDMVLRNPWNEFSESSAREAAALAWDMKDYTTAIVYYTRLRTMSANKQDLQIAYNGLMQCNFNTRHFNEAVLYADSLLSLPGVNENAASEAHFYKAKSLQEFNKPEEALAIYLLLEGSKDGAMAAESRYHIAEIYFKQHKVKESEKAANNTIRLSAGNEYWIIKSYILLADIMATEKDYFNAKATLQSIVKNTKIPELKEEANKKLQQVKLLEKQKSKLSD